MRVLQQLRKRRRTLPLRVWLVLAVVAITGAGYLAQVGMTTLMFNWQQQAASSLLSMVRHVIGIDSTVWRDPTWQRRAGESLGAQGVEIALYSGSPAQLVYATASARQLLSTDASSSSDVHLTFDNQPFYNPLSQQPPTFQRIIISPSQPGAQPAAVAFLWFTRPAAGTPAGLVWSVVELGVFALTLALIVALVGPPVLRPLSAMSRAAESIAGGDLNVRLASSPVREIAEVSSALEGMSRALAESLERQSALEEERRLFVAAIAHDLRTPLFMLRGYLKGLESGIASSPQKVAHYVETCRAKADDLERLVADLFAYTRLEYLDQEPVRSRLDLGAILRRAVDDARLAADAKQVTLSSTWADSACIVTGDPRLLTRVVANLLDNALRYTPPGGVVTARCEHSDDRVIFTVDDTGPGFTAQDLPRLFTPLYRADSSRNRQTGGAGLGLAIARRILRAHGGDLTAANRPTGGATLTGELPAAQGQAPATDPIGTEVVSA